MEIVVLIFIGNINIKEEKLSVIWCVVMIVDFNGVIKSVIIVKRVILKKRVVVIGKFKWNRWINFFGCGLWKVLNIFICVRCLEVMM